MTFTIFFSRQVSPICFIFFFLIKPYRLNVCEIFNMITKLLSKFFVSKHQLRIKKKLHHKTYGNCSIIFRKSNKNSCIFLPKKITLLNFKLTPPEGLNSHFHYIMMNHLLWKLEFTPTNAKFITFVCKTQCENFF